MTEPDTFHRHRTVSHRTSSNEARRAAIVQEAAALFDRDGFYKVSMERLAEVAGMAKPTLYHYFGSKGEILYEIHRTIVEPLLKRAHERKGADIEPDEHIAAIIHDVFEMLALYPGYIRVFFEYYRELPPLERSEVRAQRLWYRRYVKGVIEEGIQLGRFRSGDSHVVAGGLLGSCNWAYHWFEGGRDEAHAAAETLATTLLYGLAERRSDD